MSSQSHLAHCRVLPLGELTVTIPEPNVTLPNATLSPGKITARCKNFIRHIQNRFSPYFIYFFFNAVWTLTSSSFRIASATLVI